MCQKRIEMHRLQELVRLHREGVGKREVARLLRMSPNTERQYREVFGRAGLLEGGSEDLPELAELERIAAAALKSSPPAQQSSSIEPWRSQIEAMVERGAKPKAIFDCLRLNKEFVGSLSAVKRMVRRIEREQPLSPEDVAVPVLSEPGEIAQVDFGYVGKLYDAAAGVMRRAWVFVVVLSHSRHMFARVVFDQRTTTWNRLHVEAFQWFGGVVETVVPDNLKAAVVRAAFGLNEDPALNRSYIEIGRHYGFKVDPTPPRAPKKKGRVESAVKYVKRNFFKPRDFAEADLEQVNAELDRWVLEIAGTREHGTTGKRPLEVFEQLERACLKPLPARKWEEVEWKKTRVHADGQVLFDKRTYPVPWRLIGHELWVRATSGSIEVYGPHIDEKGDQQLGQVRVATHKRGCPVPAEIADQYLPPQRAALRHRSRSFWTEKADRLGKEVGEFVREIFESEDVLSQLRNVQAVVTHLEKFPPERRRRACERASYYGNLTYRGIRDILRKGLDSEPLPQMLPLVFDHTRAATNRPRYARTMAELMAVRKEDKNGIH